MKLTRFSLFLAGLILFGLNVRANDTIPEKHVIEATPIKVDVRLPDIPGQVSGLTQVEFSYEELRTNPSLTEGLVNNAVDTNNIVLLENVLKIYRTFPSADPILIQFADAKIAKSKGDFPLAIHLFRTILAHRPELNPVRIELAIVLFLDKQDSAAKAQFAEALREPSTPQDITALIRQYLHALNERDSWQFGLSGGYLREKNVNNVSDNPRIENTAFVKGNEMLPQKAHGLRFNVGLERDFNLFNAHYLHIENLLYGKTYWDNRDYDDVTNRTYVGYTHKSAVGNWAVLPFYERQWYGGHRYRKGAGVRGEMNHWFDPVWQVSMALEYSKSKYHQSTMLNGNNKLASVTLFWLRKPHQFFYSGVDYSLERTAVRRYSYDFKALRLGWRQQWTYGITTQLSGSIAKRNYRDHFALNDAFRFNKARKDRIYMINATLWKQDWQLWGITPKLNFNWKKQRSNFDSLYSYIDRNVNILVEKTF